MDPELETLLKAWEAYLETPRGPEAERLRAIYESKVEEVAPVAQVPSRVRSSRRQTVLSPVATLDGS